MRRLPAALLAATLMGALGAIPHAQDAPLELQVKAAFLYQFSRFVAWPDADDSGPIHFCVAAEKLFGDVLGETIRGESVNGRPLAARTILAPEPGCHVLYIPERPSGPVYLREARGRPVLTVGEVPGFLDQGGIIRFFLEGSNVRFEVNLDAAERAGLRLSSRLIQLARYVRPAARGLE